MGSEDTKVLEFNQYQKYNKAQFIIYADLECLIKKIDGCKNNPEKYLQQKQANWFHQVFQCPIFLFKSIEIKHDVYRGTDYMKKICESLRDYAMKIINFKRKKNELINKRAAGII